MMIKKINQLFYIAVLLQISSVHPLLCQIISVEALTEKFSRYISENPWEEVFLHTDRCDYVAGEEIWFAAYLVDRQTGKPSDRSSITYAELLNSNNIPLVQKRISTPGGFGPGDILIPDTLSTGKYLLRAYTGWMKNYFPFNCFIKEINIYNPLKPAERIAVTVTSDTTDIGSLPERIPKNNWLVDTRTDEMNITVSVISRDKQSDAEAKSCMIFIHTHGIIDYAGSLVLTGGRASLILRRDRLTAGINHITLFTASGTPVAERYIYTPPGDMQLIEVSAPVKSGKREKLTLEVRNLLPPGLTADSAILSVSIVPAEGSDTLSDLSDYMVFGSEFGALPGFYYNKLTAESADSILKRLHSRWIDWNNILSDSLAKMSYTAEKDGHTISGRLLRKDTRMPVPDKVLYLSTPGKKAIFQYSRTERNGLFNFRVPLTIKVSDIIIQPEIPGSEISLEFDSPFMKDYRTHSFVSTADKLKIPGFMYRWGANVQVARIYGSRFSENSEKPPGYQPEIKRFYGKPDIELKLDDYIKLPVMTEVFFELLQGVSLRERKAGYEITILDPVEMRPYIKPPLLMVDGVVIHDASVIAGIDPEIVEQIDVVKERYIVGDYLIYGLVNVITRSGDFSRLTLPDYAVRLRFRTIDPVNNFWSPDYSRLEERNSRIPDFRNTLYWNGSVKSPCGGKKLLEFWSSDYAGEYMITVQGLTASGVSLSARKKIVIN